MLKASVLSLWSSDQSSPEGLNGVCCGKVLCRAIPQSDTRGEERMLVDIYPAELDQEHQMVVFGAEVGREGKKQRCQ